MKINSSGEAKYSLKKSTRISLRKKRDSIPAAVRHEKSIIITNKFLKLECYRDSSRILAYHTFRSEVDTRMIIRDALARKKEVALPRVCRQGLDLFYVKDLPEDVEPGSFTIMEPIPSRCGIAGPGEIDMVIVPGVGFDRSLNRLGYGGGFYDRLFSKMGNDIPKIALAFDIQVIDEVPVSIHDFKVDMLITETTEY